MIVYFEIAKDKLVFAYKDAVEGFINNIVELDNPLKNAEEVRAKIKSVTDLEDFVLEHTMYTPAILKAMTVSEDILARVNTDGINLTPEQREKLKEMLNENA